MKGKYIALPEGKARPKGDREEPLPKASIYADMAAMASYDKYIASLPIYERTGSLLELKEGEEFEAELAWHIHTSSYQGESDHYFDTEVEADKKYWEWANWNGNLQAHTDKPRQVLVPIPEKEKEERGVGQLYNGAYHIPLKNIDGHITVTGDAPPELIEALNKLAELAFKSVTPKPTNK